MRQKKIWIPIAALVVIAAVLLGIFLFGGGDARKLREQLDLGQKYLSEMNYEEAVVAFNQAIALDPRSVDAYMGLADAYMGLGDTDAAFRALEDGYEATGDDRLTDYMNELNDRIHALWEEWTKISSELPYFFENRVYLTYEEREAAFRPFVAVIEEFLKKAPWESSAYDALSKVYRALNEWDNALAIRQEGYERTGDEYLLAHEDDVSHSKTDDYGTTLEGTNFRWTLNERRQVILQEITEGQDKGSTMEYSYDESGRNSVETYTGYYNGELYMTYVDRYTYNGDGTVNVDREGVNYSSGEAENFTNGRVEAFDEYGQFTENVSSY